MVGSITYLGSEDGGSSTHKRGSRSRRRSEEGGYGEPFACCVVGVQVGGVVECVSCENDGFADGGELACIGTSDAPV
jgi:hypothetical protein